METESDLPPLYNSDGEPDWDAAGLIAYKKINFGNRIKRINNTTSNESPDEDDGEPQPKKKAGKNRKSKKSNKPKKDSLLEKKKKSKSEEPKVIIRSDGTEFSRKRGGKVGTEAILGKTSATYMSRFEFEGSDEEPMHLFQDKAPASKYLFRIPYTEAPSKGHGYVMQADPEPDIRSRGIAQIELKDLDEAAFISAETHSSGMAWSYLRRVPQISNRNKIEDHVEKQEACISYRPFYIIVWQLNQYRFYEPSNPEKDDGYRFIFTGSNRQNGNLFQNYFMQLKDLRKRIGRGNNLVAQTDKETILGGDTPYPLWNNNGKLVEKSDHLLKQFLSIGNGGASGTGEHDETEWTKNSFMWYCRLARQAQANPGLSYSVLARFWDKKWEPVPDLVLLVDSSHAEKVLTYEGGKLKDPSNVEERATTKLKNLINEIKKQRLFQPNFKIVWDKDSVPEKYTLWVEHPGHLYSIYIDKGVLNDLKGNVALAMWLDDRQFPKPEQVQGADEKIKEGIKKSKCKGTYRSGKDAIETETWVTRKSMMNVKRQTRNPDQLT
ncbi:hypothetical protein FRC19_006671, partial [Serendipita sp. 401]